MLDFLEYNDVFKEDRGALNGGRLKVTSQGIIFKNNKTGKVEQIPGADIENLNWQRMSNGFGLRVVSKSNLWRFVGFVESDYEKLNKFFDHNFSVALQPKDFCLKGWNWGQANFKESVLSFDIDKHNTVTLEFHQNDDAAVSLMELRFHIPTQSDGIVDDPVQAFMEAVLSKASIIQATGDAIATFSELQCLTPRGRYDIKIFPTFIQLHGKTFDYKIPLTTILRLFRLPHKDNRQVFFVLSLDPPIKQGQTRYHFLILLFNKDDNVKLELTVPEKEFQEKYEGKLDQVMEGPTVEVLGKIMKAIVQRKITVPGSMGSGNPAITCSYRAGAGLLYPLERGFIYVHKPPVHIRFEEILSINFARSGGSTRSFDFEVETKSGIIHTFSSIEKEEYSKLYDFVTSKNLRVKNRGTEPSQPETVADDLIDSDLEDEPDAYLARVKQEGRDREAGDSDESDESFNPGDDDSDVAEEFDSNASESSSSEGSASDGKHKKEKKKEKEKGKEKEKEKEKEKKTKKKKEKKSKSKDANKPKKPMTAYFLWLQENREKLKKDHPNLPLTELTRKAAEIWKESIKDKSKWEKEAQELKKKYERDMAAYKASGGGSEVVEKKGKSDKSDKKEKSKSSPKIKSGSGSGFKSREYIDDDDSSSAEEERKRPEPVKRKKKSSSSEDSSD
ncbi:FACT complex subunit SSRP1-like protein [Dinothrombium tinctorium]|uniref:FACT complex subunit SSRP1 n=1 Tax=Dinothrombium tinctorium TaxID=1965070 RepID=A0A3S3NVT3_9ACAR|nr:FACT complex subunit SSRP1-like protein [Dinothrombium tinctorium]RWS10115.1 FACT complex subunit SSRP1-like protein [Dinothrombium tinctorium]